MRYWLKSEDDLLKELFPNSDVSREDLMKVFCRSWDAVKKRANRLKLVRVEKGLVDYEYLAKLRQKLPKRVIE